jgi:hypothetical protein
MRNVIIGLLSCFLLSATAALAGPTDPQIPNATLTPGAVSDRTSAQLCDPHFHTTTVRNVPESEKRAVYKEYGLTPQTVVVNGRNTSKYEVDHLISLELGGTNDIKNLWPQSYVSTPYNAHIKDKLENRLHKMVCAGQITLQDAQKGISTNWIQMYNQIFGGAK